MVETPATEEVGAGGDICPVVMTIGGIEVVTIPLADYSSLLAARRQLASLVAAGLAPVPAVSRSPIERDPEVADFLEARFGSAPVWEILRACVDRFGQERTPSRSAAYLFWQRVRARPVR